MTRAGAIALALVAAGVAGDRARGDAPRTPGFFTRTLADADQALAQLVASRVPPLQPPTPVAVAWKARRLVSIDLGAPLVDLAAGDLDGDGRAELVALTTRDVVVLGARGARGLVEIARVAVPADAPAIEPRDPVGAVVVARAADGPASEILARVSTAGRGARYALSGADLREQAPTTGFPWCAAPPGGGRAARTAELVPGRDYFGGEGPERVFAVRCRDDLVDETGRPLAAVATLGPGGALDVALTTRCAPDDHACPPERHVQITGVGAAFAIADVDHDGRPDVIASGDGAPGDPDSVSVFATPRTGARIDKPVYRKRFNGGVAGLAAADLDGNGTLDVVAAVRLAGATRVDFWLLD